MVAEQLTGEPARRALVFTRRQVDPQPLAGLDRFRLLGLEILPCDRLAPGQLGPHLEEPVAQRERRAAVLLVVGRDPVEQRAVSLRAPALVGDDRVRAAPDRRSADEPRELLGLLQGVCLGADDDRLADDRQQVDEHPTAQQVVDLALAAAVLAHQPLDHAALVATVVVKVHVGVVLEALVHEVDQALEGGLLARPVVRPDRSVLGAVRPAEHEPEQELEPPRGLEDRVVFEVEHDVAKRRLRQQVEPTPLLDLPRAPDQAPFPLALELDRRLLAQPVGRLLRKLADPERRRRLGERRAGRDPCGGQPLDLVAPDVRHPREVILRAPPLLADRLEVADGAVVARVRLGRRPVRDRLEKPIADTPVVRGQVGKPERLALVRPEHDVRRLRLEPLDPRDHLRVEAELERMLGLRPPCELRIEYLVGEVAERGRSVDALEEVGEAAPSVEHEHRLVDVGRPVAHRLLGAPRRGLEVAVLPEPDRDDLVPGVEQRLEVGGLVLRALLLEQLAVRVGVVRLLDLPERRLQLELRQVLAGNEPAEVGG